MNARAIRRAVLARLTALLAFLPMPVFAGLEAIFLDGFESRNTLGWSSELPPLETPTVFRWTDLDLRDPHVYMNIVTCADQTPHGALFFSVNDELQNSIVSDDDLDGFLDYSQLLVFRPLDPLAVAGRLDDGATECLAPNPPASCAWTMPPVPISRSYDGFAAGTCLEPIGGTTNGSYSPAISTPVAPCFLATPGTVTLNLFSIPIVLHDVRVAARFVDDPVASLADGLFMGFLTEADADATVIPNTFPIVGGQPFSILLPGGTGNCAAHDDRDLLDGVSGWWIYMNFVAEPVTFTGR